MSAGDTIREQLLRQLRGEGAHMTFDAAVADFPESAINERPPHVPYTPWQLIEHMRITQWDILGFIRNPDHVSPSFPEGHWPAPDATASVDEWNEALSAYRADLHDLQEMARDPETDLFASIPHAPGYTIFRELLVIADHNAYHTGEFAILRQVMQSWPEGRQISDV